MPEPKGPKPPTETIYEYCKRIKNNDGHVPMECAGCDSGCMFCDGGLFACSVCNSFEGATTSECPGVAMTSEQSDAVYAGKLDFRNGKWNQRCSIHTGLWYNTEEGQEFINELKSRGEY